MFSMQKSNFEFTELSVHCLIFEDYPKFHIFTGSGGKN